MKKIILCLVVLLLAGFYVKAKVRHFWYGKTLSTRQVCKKWGSAPFNEKKFSVAGAEDPGVRAKMTCSLLKNQKKYVGRNVDEVIKLFGQRSGYYFSDTVPTYLIQVGKTVKEESWQIVLLVDRKDNISKIIVNEN